MLKKVISVASLAINVLFISMLLFFVISRGGVDYLMGKVQSTINQPDPIELLEENTLYQQN